MTSHGTVRAYSGGCRCAECVDGQRRYQKRWQYDRARGVSRTVPAESVRPHLEAILATGLTRQDVYRATGVSCASQRAILGMPGRDGRPQPTVKRHVAARIAAFIPAETSERPTDIVPARGTVLRIRALMAIGWTAADINARAGCSVASILHRANRGVTVSTRDRVRAVYDDLWATPGPSDTNRRLGRLRGWLVPLALDDDRLDDPAYVPDVAALRVERPKRRGDKLDPDEVADLIELGYSAQAIADRFGTRLDSVQAYLRRHKGLSA